MGISSVLRRLRSSHVEASHACDTPSPLLQVGAIPFRFLPDGSIELLLVTSRRSGRWIIPKGWPLSAHTPAESAEIEAYEEAGVLGMVSDATIGSFSYNKQRQGKRAVRCSVAVFALRVETELPEWPEHRQRARRWWSPDDAAEAVANAELAHLIAGLTELMATQGRAAIAAAA